MEKCKILNLTVELHGTQKSGEPKDGQAPVVTLGEYKRKRAMDEDSGKFCHYNPEFLIATI